MEIGKLINEFERKLVLQDYNANSVSNYISCVKIFLEFIKEKDLIPEHVDGETIEEFLIWKTEKKQISNSHTRTIITSVEKFYKLLYTRKFEIKHLYPHRDAFLIPNCLTMSEMRRMLEVTDNIRHRCMIMLLYGSGLRLNEMLHLKIADIDIRNMLINIRHSKGDVDRVVMLPKTALINLQLYLKKYKPVKFLFEGHSDKVYSQKAIQMIVRNAAIKAGIRNKVTPFTLRHSFAIHLLESGIEIRHIQQLMGHHSIKTTEIYNSISEVTKVKVVSPLDFL